MSDLDVKRSELVAAALEVTPETWTDVHLIKALCEAATAYAAVRPTAAPKNANENASISTPPSTAVFPNYGKTAGQPVRGASKRDLEFYRNGCVRTLADGSKSRWHEKERTLLAAIDLELARINEGRDDGPEADAWDQWGDR